MLSIRISKNSDTQENLELLIEDIRQSNFVFTTRCREQHLTQPSVVTHLVEGLLKRILMLLTNYSTQRIGSQFHQCILYRVSLFFVICQSCVCNRCNHEKQPAKVALTRALITALLIAETVKDLQVHALTWLQIHFLFSHE